MYGIETAALDPENFIAGEFPIARDFGAVKEGATVRIHAPVAQTSAGIEEAGEETLDDLMGIAAEEPSDGQVVVYLTGEFFSDALVLPSGVTAEALKPAFRKLGIFLKEMKKVG
jgi:hypothetical protein